MELNNFFVTSHRKYIKTKMDVEMLLFIHSNNREKEQWGTRNNRLLMLSGGKVTPYHPYI